MSRGRRNLQEGIVTFATGLGLWLFAGDVDVPLVTLTKTGVVLMCVGGALAAAGLWQAARRGP
ncbi:hypothetical protein SAMN06272771_5433 [Streptomyces sp. Ag82_O1-12]|uniref:DUF5708 family protein n=1 Tax=unclassified Streptomyces TaxID=2593676 RepID=UPI000BD8F4D3|nr:MULTISPECIES: DUF5708 family protein [unclassified Streptomyces]SMQ18968.1 hypothetical protein SAMN06272771_5433 [Streptomyces sp. Ag82_O1-12]SOD48009.1 hypothetical protein SAMN06272727_5436 [Streptomyces sp. Ag82_G6-1]